MKLRAPALIAIAGLGTALAQQAGVGPPGRAQPEKPRVITPNCTTAGCHADQLKHTFVHGPTAVGACTMCHTPREPADHTFDLKAQGKELCTFCHTNKTGPGGAFPHEPFAKGDCLSCHDPHGSESKSMLVKPDTRTLCLSCHEKVLDNGGHTHKPVGDGSCTVCHKSHAADHAKLLVQPARSLCLSCHDDVQHQIGGSKMVHEPVMGDCLACHKPHVSPQQGLLKAAPVELCTACHQEVGKEALGATHKHSAVTEGQACLACHQPHASDRPKLAKADPAAACLSCHKQPEPPKVDRNAPPPAPVFRADLARERAAAAIAAAPVVLKPAPPLPELSAQNPHLHGPLKEGDCAACHTVHGGEERDLLRAPYSTDFYQAFSQDAFSLCFSCHDASLATESQTATATNFRAGDRNLHFVHVNKDQGRSCRACHNVHASNNDALIRESTTFGNWQLPITYTRTETGGSCAVGCHKPQSYDRGGPAAKPPLHEPSRKAPELPPRVPVWALPDAAAAAERRGPPGS